MGQELTEGNEVSWLWISKKRKKASQSLASYVSYKSETAMLGTGFSAVTSSSYQLELQKEGIRKQMLGNILCIP